MPEEAKKTVCHYQHHSEYGKEITCKCGEPLTCGPFDHACEKCNPFQFQPCGMCGQKRINCCC